MRRFQQSYLLAVHFLAFTSCFAIFFVGFGLEFPFLLRPSRTSLITAITFLVVYTLMTLVYGGMDIGKKKGRPIALTFVAKLLPTDLLAHLFLCIMNVTVVNGGRFVYESPWVLVCVYVVQVLVTTALAYFGNDLYFHFTPPSRCLVIAGVGQDASGLVQRIGKLKKQYRVVKILHTDAPDLLGEIDQVDGVFFYNVSPKRRAMLIEYCFQVQKNIYHSVEIQDVVGVGSCCVNFGDMPIMAYQVKSLSMEQRIFKRLLDLSVSALVLLVASPFMLITALAIKLEDGGHVFYKQPRVTSNNKVFSVLKFRSMREGVGNIHRSASKDDDRITRVGRVIRKFRIDELPQLINILRGEMSLVGPRPEMVENVQKYTSQLPEFAYRHRVKAGLTGLAQIYGKYNTSPKDKLAMDLMYIERYSFWLDLKLILQTAMVLLSAEESTEEFVQEDPQLQKDEQQQEEREEVSCL